MAEAKKTEDKKARFSRCLSDVYQLDEDDARWLSSELGGRAVVFVDDKGQVSSERTAKALDLAKTTGIFRVEGGKTLDEVLESKPSAKIPACSVTGAPTFEGKVHGVEWEKLPVSKQEVAGLAVLRGLLGDTPDDAKRAFWALQQSLLPPPFHDLCAEWEALSKKEEKTEEEEELVGKVRRRRFWKAQPRQSAVPPPPPPPPPPRGETFFVGDQKPLVYVYAPPGENFKVAGELAKRLRPYEQNGVLRAVTDETEFRMSPSRRAQLMREATLVVYVMSQDCLEGTIMTEIQAWMQAFTADQVMVAAGKVVGVELYPGLKDRMPMLPRGMKPLRACAGAAVDDWWAALVEEVISWVKRRRP